MTRDPSFAEYTSLPDAEKLRLCHDLLNEFGATRVTVNHTTGEMIHSCCLPFGGHAHGDRHPSASLNYKKLVYACLSCGNSGGLLWWIGACRGTAGYEARDWLGSRTGASTGSLSSLLSYLDSLDRPEVERPAPIPRFSPKVLGPWLYLHSWLTAPRPEGRGIPEDMRMQFKVGFNPVAKVKMGEEWVPSERIVLPHFWKGELVGWQTRRWYDDGTPKYLSSPDFPKDSTLYNHDPTKDVVVVEGILSVLARYHDCLAQSVNMEATFGASVTERQVYLLAHHPSVTLFMDNDAAGWKATQKLGAALIGYLPVWVVANPYNADPADIDSETFAAMMECRVPWSVWRPPDPNSLMPVVRPHDPR